MLTSTTRRAESRGRLLLRWVPTALPRAPYWCLEPKLQRKKACTFADATLFLCVYICLGDPAGRHVWVGPGNIWMIPHLVVKFQSSPSSMHVACPFLNVFLFSHLLCLSDTSQISSWLHSLPAEKRSSSSHRGRIYLPKPWAEPSHPNTAWSGSGSLWGLLQPPSPFFTEQSLNSFSHSLLGLGVRRGPGSAFLQTNPRNRNDHFQF